MSLGEAVITKMLISARWLSLAGTAEHPGTVYACIAKKHMSAHRVGRDRTFQKIEIGDWDKTGGASDVSEDGEEW